MEPMNVKTEVWAVAADQVSIWLISGDDAWRPTLPISSDGDPHFEVQNALDAHGALATTSMIHSTSWRPDGPSIVLTYLAVIQTEGLVIDTWPDAKPISLRLAEAVGRPPEHEPTEPPMPRYIDVLVHGLRHLRFLQETDDLSAATLTLPWRRHLAKLDPALAVMYKTA